MHLRFWWKKLRKRDHLENLSLNGKIIIEHIINKSVGMALIGVIWLRIGTNLGLFER